MFGDFLTQNANRPKDGNWEYNYGRSMAMGAAGALVAAPLCLAFLRWMDVAIYSSNPNTALALSVKFVSDQVVGCLLWQLAFLSLNSPYRQSALLLVKSTQASLVGQKEVLQRSLWQ